MRQAERLGLTVSDYIRLSTTLRLEQDEGTEPDLQHEGDANEYRALPV